MRGGGRMSPAEYRHYRRHNDRLLTRLTIDDGAPTLAESALITAACFGLVLLTLWAAI